MNEASPMKTLYGMNFQTDKSFLFNDGVLLHIREPEIIGFETGGCGIPQAMFCYGVSRHTFGLRKMNEVLASDYLVPMRVLSPSHPPKDGGGFQESYVVDMADWNVQTKSLIARHRKDPASIHTVGFPIQYQVLGGEGKDLVPSEMLVHAEDMQLNAAGIPPEMHRGTLTVQSAPMTARLFESHHQHIPAAGNTVLKWVVEKITPHLGWKEFGV